MPEQVIPIIGMAVTVVVNVATLAYISGTTIARLNFAERELEKLSEEIKDIRSMKEDLAVVKSTLDSTQKTLLEIKTAMSSKKMET